MMTIEITTNQAAHVCNPADRQFDGLSNYSDQDMQSTLFHVLLDKIQETPGYDQNWKEYDKLEDDYWDDKWAIVARAIDPFIVMMAFYGDAEARRLVEAQVALMFHSIRLRRYWKVVPEDQQPAHSEQLG